ncbi:site-specific integrase [bacterium]|nr:site-specific integrase [bacterium]
MAGLYDAKGRRRYLTISESQVFLKELAFLSRDERLLCLYLLYCGTRISEALSFKKADLDVAAGEVIVRTLKQRGEENFRRIPLPLFLLTELQDLKIHSRYRVWRFSRSTAWRIVKKVMKRADIEGVHATCKGLRHSFGVRTLHSSKEAKVTDLQKLMGHKDLKTTLIYVNVMGDELRELMQPGWDALES